MLKTYFSRDQIFTSRLQTDFGWMRSVSDGNNLIRLDWRQSSWPQADHPDSISRETLSQIQAYLRGKLKELTLPLHPDGASDVKRHWLNVMARIPYGQTMTYSEYANYAGKPKAARSAGSLCANNPIPIIYPCHRVIRADGKLGNYSGGDKNNPTSKMNVARKKHLLLLEAQKTNKMT